jgi:hypothetical protein
MVSGNCKPLAICGKRGNQTPLSGQDDIPIYLEERGLHVSETERVEYEADNVHRYDGDEFLRDSHIHRRDFNL